MDVQKEPFTVAGIGDMAGDVFGNGVLLSRATRLVAAFNHVHIFIDPDPDPEASFEERERLFTLPRSTWRDYNPALISKGGGIFDRSAKAIPLSPEMRAAARHRGRERERRGGDPRASSRPGWTSSTTAGSAPTSRPRSRTTPTSATAPTTACAWTAKEVRARVVAEGGNLGFTQKGRLEYWARGGLVNTDAVDNSGGVDMSDHEVNIKILLDMLVKKGDPEGTGGAQPDPRGDDRGGGGRWCWPTTPARRAALTLDGLRSAAALRGVRGLVDDLRGPGSLSRADDAVPTRDELLASPQRDRGLPRPLLAVLLGYTKMWAFAAR